MVDEDIDAVHLCDICSGVCRKECGSTSKIRIQVNQSLVLTLPRHESWLGSISLIQFLMMSRFCKFFTTEF